MAKKKRGRRSSNKSPVEEQQDEDLSGVKQDDEDFYFDDIDKFHANKDKLLLEKDDFDDDSSYSDEEEVLAVGSDSDEGEEESQDEDEAVGNHGLTSTSAWGQKKALFYGADTLDGLEGSDREEAEKAEEEEVLAIQKRLAEQIDEDDFGLDMFNVAEVKKDEQAKGVLETSIAADFSSLSTKAQWKLVKKESPELDGLIHDFRTKLSELESEVSPLMKLVKKGRIPQGTGSDYVNLKYRVYTAYLLNISFYLALKTSNTEVKNHPIISRLVQYRTVINQLSPIEKKLRPEIDELLAENIDMVHDDISDSEKPISRTNETAISSVESDSDEKEEEAIITKQSKRKADKMEKQDEFDMHEFSKTMIEKLEESKDSEEKMEHELSLIHI